MTILDEDFKTLAFTVEGDGSGNGCNDWEACAAGTATAAGGGVATYQSPVSGTGIITEMAADVTIDWGWWIQEYSYSYSCDAAGCVVRDESPYYQYDVYELAEPVSYTDNNGQLSGTIDAAGEQILVTGTLDVSARPFTVEVSTQHYFEDYWVTASANWTGTVDTPLPDIFPTTLTTARDAFGQLQLEVAFDVGGGLMATADRAAAVTNVRVYWASGPTVDDIIADGELGELPVYWNQSRGVASIGPVTSVPAGARYLLAVADRDGLVEEADEGNNVLAVDFLRSDDIVGRNQYGYLWVAKSNGVNAFSSGIWGQWSTARTWSNVMTGDFNGDGYDDVVGRNEFGYWWVAASNGSNGFASSIWGKWDPTRTWTNVMVGDFNGDGCDDLVGRNQFGYWWVATGNASGSFSSSIWGKWDTARTWNDVMVGDFNKDGCSDLVARNEFGYWWVAASNGSNGFTSSIWGKWDPSRTWTNVMVGDFNADGADDLVGRNQYGYWWVAASNGSDTLSNAIWGQWSTARTWTDVMVGYFDGNGAADVVGRNDYGYWWVAKSNGTSAFNSGIWGQWDNTRNWTNVMVGDFNRDGYDDVVGRDKLNYWWVQKSNGWDRFANEYWGKWNAVDWFDVRGGDFGT